jgi:hypothetical protein
MAGHFKALAEGKRSVYTCPIKALVNEKWMTLCREFGPENVGLSTGDASVNRDAPILCCTAEILANIALREGARANVQEVIMDEFHYYADRERGVAWQAPLLDIPAKRLLFITARAFAVPVINPVADHVLPWSVDRNTPWLITPAKIESPHSVKAVTHPPGGPSVWRHCPGALFAKNDK